MHKVPVPLCFKYVFDALGRNSRIDEIQAAILLAKLPHLDAVNQRRKEIAARYEREVSNPLVRLLLVDSEQYSRSELAPRDCVYHIFPVFCARRDELQQYLADNGVETQIHYPIPPHKQRCYNGQWSARPKDACYQRDARMFDVQLNHLSLPVTEQIHRDELSIPCNQAMTDDDVSTIIRLLNQFS